MILAVCGQQRRAAHRTLVVRLRSWPSPVGAGPFGLAMHRPGGLACMISARGRGQESGWA